MGRVDIPTAFTNTSVTVNGLEPGRCYAMYATAQDDAPPPGPNVRPEPTTGPYVVCTDDASPPSFIITRGEEFTKESFNLTASLNETGVYFYVVLRGDICGTALPSFPPVSVRGCIV